MNNTQEKIHYTTNRFGELDIATEWNTKIWHYDHRNRLMLKRTFKAHVKFYINRLGENMILSLDRRMIRG